jgi:hypothetical protein
MKKMTMTTCMAAAGRTFLASKISKENKKGVVFGQANVD